MSGINTNGLPLAVSGNLTSTALIPVDTNLPNGQNPQSVAATLAQIAGARGAPSVIVDTALTTKILIADASLSDTFSVLLTTTGYTLTITNPEPGQVIDVYVKEDASGSRTITTYTNVLWAGGTPPTLTATANATDLLTFRYNSTLGKWVGTAVLNVS